MDHAPGLVENTTLIGRMWAEGSEMKAEIEQLRAALGRAADALDRAARHHDCEHCARDAAIVRTYA